MCFAGAYTAIKKGGGPIQNPNKPIYQQTKITMFAYTKRVIPTTNCL
jgi:hypothetical protein